MQVIFKNEDKRRCSRRTDSVDFILCIGGIHEHMEGEYIGESRFRKFRI